MKIGIQVLDQFGIEAVEPDHRLLAEVVVVMPGPVGLSQKVAWFHDHLHTIRGSISPMPLDNEPNGRSYMSVCPGRFSRPNVLKPRVQSSTTGQNAVGPAEGILADPHDLRGALQGRIDVAPAPEFRLDGRGAASRSTDIPISCQANFVVQCLERL